MGRGGKQAKSWGWKGEQWPNKYGEDPDSWRQPSSSRGRWEDWRQQRRVPEEPAFPTYTMMSSAGSRSTRDQDEAENDRPLTKKMGLAKGYQRLVTVARKAEVRMRKAEEDMEAAKQCWKTFQDKLQQAYVKERLRHRQDLERLEEEIAQQEKAQRDAFRDLQAAIANPASLKDERPAELPEDILTEWGKLLEGCDDEDVDMKDIEETFTEKLSKQLQEVLEPPPRTPQRRGTDRTAPRTPPCVAEKDGRGQRQSLDRFLAKAAAVALQRQKEQQEERETAEVINDPYMTSPSANVGQPSPPQRAKSGTPSVPIKLKGRHAVPSPRPGTTLADKLDRVRFKGADNGTDAPMPRPWTPTTRRT